MSTPSQPAPPPVSADVGIVAALGIELNPFLDRLERVRKYRGRRYTVIEGDLSGKLVAVVLAGAGRRNAQSGAEALLDGHRPRWIVSPGFAGALNPDLKRNDIVLASEVVNAEGRRYGIDLAVPEGEGLHAGRLLTVDAIVRTAAEKAELRRAHGADVVDMESSAVAALCAERGVRFLSVRVVSDEAGSDLPPEVLAIFGPSGGVRLGAAVGAVWKRPASVKELLAFRGHAVEAADALSRFLLATLPRLG